MCNYRKIPATWLYDEENINVSLMQGRLSYDYMVLNGLLTPKTVEHYYPANYTLMMAVVSNPYLEICEKKVLIKRMLELGFNINDRNIYGETALYIATKRGVEDIILYLLENGANPDISNQLSNT